GVIRVSILPGEEYSGDCEIRGPFDPPSPDETKAERRQRGRALIVASYAGVHAQRLAGNTEIPDECGSKDRADAVTLATVVFGYPRHVSLDKYLDDLNRKSARLVLNYREAIRVLAEELLLKKQLDGEAAEAIVRPFLLGQTPKV